MIQLIHVLVTAICHAVQLRRFYLMPATSCQKYRNIQQQIRVDRVVVIVFKKINIKTKINIIRI